jgi:hypothetical protein
MSINIPNVNINAFLKKIPSILSRKEEERIEAIFGSSAYTKKSPGAPVRMTLHGKPNVSSHVRLVARKPNNSELRSVKSKLNNVGRQLNLWKTFKARNVGPKNLQNLAKLKKLQSALKLKLKKLEK